MYVYIEFELSFVTQNKGEDFFNFSFLRVAYYFLQIVMISGAWSFGKKAGDWAHQSQQALQFFQTDEGQTLENHRNRK